MEERLQKIIAAAGICSRRAAESYLSAGRVTVNGRIASLGEKANAEVDEICVDGNPVRLPSETVCLVLNKPKGYVSATEDRDHKTVLELVPEEFAGRDLFPAGRLDRDTTGLMIITDDGQMAHNILSPKKHVQKIYHVEIDIPVTEEMSTGFAKGVELNDGVCKEASLEITGEKTCFVTLKEGRYHQIKRMFGCFGAKVLQLHRVAMGNLRLPEDLEVGQIRELTDKELKLLQQQL